MILVNNGLFCGSVMKAIMVYAPVPSPDAPSPLKARPTINVVAVGARPQMRLPSMKTKIDKINVAFSGKYLYALPQND